MDAAARRAAILSVLERAEHPVSAAALAREFSVSRQIIVGDVALLNAIVDQGCTVIDVIVEHPIYGQLTGPLQLSSRYDVAQFVDRCRQSDALPLSNLTEGIHLHTISCPSEATFQRVRAALEQLGVLLEA